ncbi:MAG: response regulator [Bacilli bacterium]|nr:response regulator [Bacilli bacterium]
MMFKNIAFQVCSLLYMFLLLGIFTYKNKKRNLKGVVFQIFLLLTTAILLLDISLNLLIPLHETKFLLVDVVNKIYLIVSLFWCWWLMVYVLTINTEAENYNLKELFKNTSHFRWGLYFTVLASILISLLDVRYSFDFELFNAERHGTAIFVSYLVGAVYMFVAALYLIKNPKKVSFAKSLPVFVFLLLVVLSMVLQWIFPTIMLVSSVRAFTLLFVYFTRENQDLKIIAELEVEKEQVEEASKAKTDFLSNMSHDIRTPMNAIIGFSEALLMEELNEKQKGEVQNIYDASTTLLQIINNILDVSRIESGKEEKNEKIYEFRKVVMQLTSVIMSKLDTDKIKLNVQIDRDVPSHFIGDELKVYQILMNLLSNAAKYTEQGHIDFLVSAENMGEYANLKFVVADSGIGIKESDFDKMFVKFSRINNQENYREIEGTGLGLVITKKLVELLGGTITFESEYGKGTTFTVIMPQKIYYGNIQNAQVQTISQSAHTNIHFDGSLYDILVVDDNNLNLKVAERILSDYKFQITLASSGEEAIKKIKEGARYDLIFLDHMMPIMDGIETLRNIRALENVKIPPIIALTANAMVGMKEMYLNEGFDGYISKPINREELQSLLNNIFCQK